MATSTLSSSLLEHLDSLVQVVERPNFFDAQTFDEREMVCLVINGTMYRTSYIVFQCSWASLIQLAVAA